MSTENPVIKDLIEKAHAGDVSAQFELAGRYATGDGLTLNQEEAAFWCKKAA